MKWKYYLLGIGILSLFVVIYVLLDFVQDDKKATSYICTSIKFEQDIIALGRLQKGDKIPIVFEYQNIGKEPLILKNVQTTCGCTEAIWSKEPLLPQHRGEIKIEFTGEDVGHFRKSIFVVCNIWKKVYQLQIVGDVID